MAMGVITDIRTEEGCYPWIKVPDVYNNWVDAVDAWQKDFVDTVEEINVVGCELISTDFPTTAGEGLYKWRIEWKELDGKKITYESQLTTATMK